MPYDYYSLPYCKPDILKPNAENLGETVSGDRSENSIYKLEMKLNVDCEIACAVDLKKGDAKAFVHAIEEDYRVHWTIDNLPVGMEYIEPSTREETFERGFPVGFMQGMKGSMKHYLNNHVRIIISYNDDDLEEGETEADRTGKNRRFSR